MFKENQVYLLEDVISRKCKKKDCYSGIDKPVTQCKLLLYKPGKPGIQEQTKKSAACRTYAKDNEIKFTIIYPLVGDEVGAGDHPKWYLHRVKETQQYTVLYAVAVGAFLCLGWLIAMHPGYSAQYTE